MGFGQSIPPSSPFDSRNYLTSSHLVISLNQCLIFPPFQWFPKGWLGPRTYEMCLQKLSWGLCHGFSICVFLKFEVILPIKNEVTFFSKMLDNKQLYELLLGTKHNDILKMMHDTHLCLYHSWCMYIFSKDNSHNMNRKMIRVLGLCRPH